MHITTHETKNANQQIIVIRETQHDDDALIVEITNKKITDFFTGDNEFLILHYYNDNENVVRNANFFDEKSLSMFDVNVFRETQIDTNDCTCEMCCAS